eukprot:2450152-Alexandrium_andersonii.AAC.1
MFDDALVPFAGGSLGAAGEGGASWGRRRVPGRKRRRAGDDACPKGDGVSPKSRSGCVARGPAEPSDEERKR